jgi:hypothetical protein
MVDDGLEQSVATGPVDMTHLVDHFGEPSVPLPQIVGLFLPIKEVRHLSSILLDMFAP